MVNRSELTTQEGRGGTPRKGMFMSLLDRIFVPICVLAGCVAGVILLVSLVSLANIKTNPNKKTEVRLVLTIEEGCIYKFNDDGANRHFFVSKDGKVSGIPR